MYTNILVPLDGSQLSEGILPYARSFAKALKVPVELIHVIDPEIISDFIDPETSRFADAVQRDLKRNKADYIKALACSFPDSSTVNCFVEIGIPAEVILNRAASQSDALITMSTHGRSGLPRWLLGSVASKVLHASTNPMLLVRATAETKTSDEATLKTILVPLDGSPLSEQVLPHVTALAKKMTLDVILLRVYDPQAQGFRPYMDLISKIVRDAAKTYLEEKVRQLQGEGLKKASYLLLQGSSAGEIVDIARATPDSFVTMCTHGKSGIKRWVLGSVTDRVVRHSEDPVLVIRAPAEVS
ncbi:MAG: universal stress protein [Candidatus Binatia bacterium]